MFAPAILGLLREAYEADPGEVTGRFAELTGQEPLAWLKK